MKKMTLRKALAPAALAVVLLTTGCDTATVDAIKESAGEAISSAASSAPSIAAPAPAPVPTTATPKTVPAAPAPAEALPSDDELESMSVTGIVSLSKGLIEGIEVKGRAPKTGYSREEFGPAWADVDRNGCDTRNDILERDMTNLTYKDGTKQCVVATGTLQDKYTGTTINFVRGQETSKAVQVEHIVALSDAFQKGAQQLTADQRKQFANDPIHLLASDGPTNQQKSDSDAASWLPPNKNFRCEYVARQTIIKEKYNLWMTQAEKDAINGVLAGC